MTTGKDLIKKFEGCKLKAYFCPAGLPTIGYGHTEGITKQDVYTGRTITKLQADILLENDYPKYEREVEALVKVPLTDNQLGALTSFVYNIGSTAFKKSTLLKLLNGGDLSSAAKEFDKWTKAGGVVLPGLVKRRAAERALFEEK